MAWITTAPDGTVTIMGDTSIGLASFTSQSNLEVAGNVYVGKSGSPGNLLVQGNLQCDSTLNVSSISASGNVVVSSVQLSGPLAAGEPTGGYTTTCTAATEGQIAYNRASKAPVFCDGTNWRFVRDGSLVGAPSSYGLSQATPGRSCLDIKRTTSTTVDRAYWIDLANDTAGAFQVFCDMSGDDGGWTLVFRDSKDGVLLPDIPDAQGQAGALLELNGTSAKLADETINALRSQTSEKITYRVTSPDIATKYYVPGSCLYQNLANNNAACRRITPAYSNSETPLYLQCGQWGGDAGGINAWYLCQPNSAYTNMVLTHRKIASNPTSISALTDNPYGTSLGGVSSEYVNRLLVWVR
jgi:hypothetical protein